MPLPDRPPLNVSFSLLRALAECPRRAAIQGPGAWQGWRGGTRHTDRLAVESYRSKFLYSLAQGHGIAVHRLFEAIVTALAAGTRPPTREDMWNGLRTSLNRLCTRSRREFERAPKDGGILLTTYLGLPRDATEVEQVRAKMGAAARRLVSAELLRDLAEADRGAVAVEELTGTPLEFPGLPAATLWAKPDVRYSTRHAAHVDGVWHAPGDGIPVFVDLKTGRRTPRAERDVRLQLAVAAYAAQRRGLVPHRTAGVVGRVLDVSPQADALGEDPTWLIGPLELADAERALRSAVATIAVWPRDRHGHVQLGDVEARPGPCCHTCCAQVACGLTLTPIVRGRRAAAPDTAAVQAAKADEVTP